MYVFIPGQNHSIADGQNRIRRISLSLSRVAQHTHTLGYQTHTYIYTHKEHLSLVNYIALYDLVSERIFGIQNKRTWFNNDLLLVIINQNK
jgi:hypothetical protein